MRKGITLAILILLAACSNVGNSETAESILGAYEPRFFCSTTDNKYGRLDGGGVVFMLDCIVEKKNNTLKVTHLLVDSAEFTLGEGKFSCLFVRERKENSFIEYHVVFDTDGIGRKTKFDQANKQCLLISGK